MPVPGVPHGIDVPPLVDVPGISGGFSGVSGVGSVHFPGVSGFGSVVFPGSSGFSPPLLPHLLRLKFHKRGIRSLMSIFLIV